MRYGRSWTDALKEVQEQTGVRKVDFVDGVTPDLQEAKPEFEVKYASSKKGPIKVSKFMSLKDAKKFLAQVKGEGMNGIISQNGKPVKEEKIECPKCKGEGCEHCDGKGYHIKEEVEIDEDKKWHYYNLDRGVYKLQKDNNGKIIGKMHDRQKEMKAGFPNADEVLSNTKQAADKVAKLNEHCGECGAMDHVDEKMDGRKKFSGKQAKKDNEDRRAAQRKKLGILGPNEETINEADYELYHKTFSGAMQHAYAHAKKRGFIVDPDEIDNKVATGPKKPSSGKTNKYILGTNKRQKLHVQVANLDNKRYELNMYIEETEMNEADKKTKDRLKMFKNLRDKKASQGFQKTDLANVEQTIRKVLEKKLDPVGQADADIDNDGDVDSSDKYLKNRRKKISQAIKKDEMYHNKKKMKKESQDDQKGDYGQKKMKRAKEPVAAPVASESKMYSHVKNLLKAQK